MKPRKPAVGVAPRIANLAEWRAHLFARLRHQVDATADPVLLDLMKEPVSSRAGLAWCLPLRQLASGQPAVGLQQQERREQAVGLHENLARTIFTAQL